MEGKGGWGASQAAATPQRWGVGGVEEAWCREG